MHHAQTSFNGERYMCGQQKEPHTGNFGVCIDSYCDICDNRVDLIDCPTCKTKIQTMKEILNGDDGRGW